MNFHRLPNSSDDLNARGCAAQNGISLQPEPAQCCDVALNLQCLAAESLTKLPGKGISIGLFNVRHLSIGQFREFPFASLSGQLSPGFAESHQEHFPLTVRHIYNLGDCFFYLRRNFITNKLF